MYKFGKESLAQLETCDHKLQLLLNNVIPYLDFKVVCGTRSKEQQDAAVAAGSSQTRWPNSRHNSNPSQAVDIIAYPIGTLYDEKPDPRDIARQYMLIGRVQMAADILGIPIRCGADWDGDGDLKDQNFHDIFHVELKKEV